MTVLGGKIVEQARQYRGKQENPLGSNTGTFVVACQRATFLGGTGWPWCAAYVCKVAADQGVALQYNGAGAHDLADHHAASKQTWSTVRPGDVVDYNIGSGHTGIVTGIDKDHSGVTSCDGNWADRVTEHHMAASTVRGFWRIPGVSAAPAPKPKRLPLFTIATSESGRRKVLFRSRSKRKISNWLMHHTLSKVAPNGIQITRPKGK